MSRGGTARSTAGLAALAAAAALVLGGCGGGDGASTAQAGQAGAGAGATGAGGTTTARKAEPASGARACASQVGEFLERMGVLRKNLVAGLDYEGYVHEVRLIRRSYEAIPVDSLALRCLEAAGTPGEKALNRYIAAGNTWTDCVETSGCDAISIEAELQAKWRQASRFLSRAQRGLSSFS
jgi:hypothetical protein